MYLINFTFQLIDSSSIGTNGLNNDGNETVSNHGTMRSGPPTSLINSLGGAGGATAGAIGQSTLSRKSGFYLDLFQISFVFRQKKKQSTNLSVFFVS